MIVERRKKVSLFLKDNIFSTKNSPLVNESLKKLFLCLHIQKKNFFLPHFYKYFSFHYHKKDKRRIKKKRKMKGWRDIKKIINSDIFKNLKFTSCSENSKQKLKNPKNFIAVFLLFSNNFFISCVKRGFCGINFFSLFNILIYLVKTSRKENLHKEGRLRNKENFFFVRNFLFFMTE